MIDMRNPWQVILSGIFTILFLVVVVVVVDEATWYARAIFKRQVRLHQGRALRRRRFERERLDLALTDAFAEGMFRGSLR